MSGQRVQIRKVMLNQNFRRFSKQDCRLANPDRLRFQCASTKGKLMTQKAGRGFVSLFQRHVWSPPVVLGSDHFPCSPEVSNSEGEGVSSCFSTAHTYGGLTSEDPSSVG